MALPRGGARPGAGRPLNVTKTLKELRRINSNESDGFREAVRQGFLVGVGRLSLNFPTIVNRLITAALGARDPSCKDCALTNTPCRIHSGDRAVQMYLTTSFLKFFQPDLVVSQNTPIMTFLSRIREEAQALHNVEQPPPPSLAEGSSIIVGSFRDNASADDVPSVHGRDEVQVGDGGRAGG